MNRMFRSGFFLLALVTAYSNVALAHDPAAVAQAADDFSHACEHFHSVIHAVTGFSHIAQDVHRLAEAAHHFQIAAAGGAPTEHLVRDFDKIHHDYDHVKRAVYQAHQLHHNPHVMQDFYRVEYTFEDLGYSLEQ